MKLLKRSRKGFTLIELLVVIAIIAILAVVVVLTLNPAQLLAQSRDSNRISDMATLKSALVLYQTDQVTSSFGSAANVTVYESAAPGVTQANLVGTTNANMWNFSASDTLTSSSTNRNITGTGWIPVNFSLISAGSPIGIEPIDPVNGACSGGSVTFCQYAFVANNTTGTFKLATKMESPKYQLNGSGDVESTDGGANNTAANMTYEQGSNLSL